MGPGQAAQPRHPCHLPGQSLSHRGPQGIRDQDHLKADAVLPVVGQGSENHLAGHLEQQPLVLFDFGKDDGRGHPSQLAGHPVLPRDRLHRGSRPRTAGQVDPVEFGSRRQPRTGVRSSLDKRQRSPGHQRGKDFLKVLLEKRGLLGDLGQDPAGAATEQMKDVQGANAGQIEGQQAKGQALAGSRLWWNARGWAQQNNPRKAGQEQALKTVGGEQPHRRRPGEVFGGYRVRGDNLAQGAFQGLEKGTGGKKTPHRGKNGFEPDCGWRHPHPLRGFRGQGIPPAVKGLRHLEQPAGQLSSRCPGPGAGPLGFHEQFQLLHDWSFRRGWRRRVGIEPTRPDVVATHRF